MLECWNTGGEEQSAASVAKSTASRMPSFQFPVSIFQYSNIPLFHSFAKGSCEIFPLLVGQPLWTFLQLDTRL